MSIAPFVKYADITQKHNKYKNYGFLSVNFDIYNDGKLNKF